MASRAAGEAHLKDGSLTSGPPQDWGDRVLVDATRWRLENSYRIVESDGVGQGVDPMPGSPEEKKKIHLSGVIVSLAA